MLDIQHVSVRFGERVVVNDLSVSLKAGQWLMLAGPNGAGKSTLINAIGQTVPYSGAILLDGRDVARMKPAVLARRVGVLAQQNHAGYAYTVQEIVELGRYAHRTGLFASSDPDSGAFIDRALEQTGLTELRRKRVTELSGGELQRVFLAQVFAQNPDILLLDEPANHLDLIHQRQIFTLIRQWLAQPGRAVISVVHDLSLARLYGTHAVLMNHGVSVAQGRAEDVFTPDILRPVYQMDVYAWMRELLSQWES